MPDENIEEETPKEETPKEEPKKEEPKLLSEEEVNKRIEKARQQEKDKLYGKIGDLEKVVTELNAKAQAEQEAKEKADAEAKAKANAKRQAELSAEDRLAEQMKKIEEQLAKEAAERQRLENRLREEEEKRDLESYRQQVLSGQEDIIPDLVKGTSKEDIDRSVAFAKARYQELFQATKSKAEGRRREVTDNMPGPTDPNPAALEEAELAKSVANLQIDPERYMKDRAYKREMDAKRQELLTRVGQAYKSSIGR